ncbi:acetyltransferase [Shewanella sp. NKUCC01_JLK]|uniref:acetyltransferase n=1 Tax=Shewanella sp. NKUCC01_JLK TaxID=2842123 RepID=UPI001C5B2365|nr:acetyltransferase [Shewanella sp. NKUCC01_JLK]MBW3514094.1 acetyltransferase [Shewanella sp. NKUCC01_JLK]
MSKPVLVLGAGGHAAAVIDILRQINCTVLGLVAQEQPKANPIFGGLTLYLSDDDVLSFDKDSILLVNAIGSLPGQEVRFKVHQQFKQLGYSFMTIVSPKAIVSDYAILSEGVQVMPGTIVNVNAYIGEGTILNTGSIIEHDCVIGKHNHIAPGAVLSGAVNTGDYVHIATGAKVIQGIQIGERALVGAGATVTKNLESNKTLYVAKPFLR